MGEGWQSTIEDDGELEAHPLVATRALLAGRARSLPSAAGQHPPSGRMGRGALDAVMAIAEALFSVDGKAPPAERIAWLRHEFDDFTSRATGQGRFLFSIAARIISLVAPLLIGKLPTLRRLSIEDRVRALTRLEERPLAPLLIALRAILCLLYYEHPDVPPEIDLGVSGPGGPVGVVEP